MSRLTHQQIADMPLRFRAHLINSLSGFKSANLIGSIDNSGLTNLAVFSSVIHLGSDPALMGFITRPNTVARHTLENITQTKQYSINHINQDIWQQAHQTSARYDKQLSEFEAVGLTPEFIDGLKIPFVKQSKVKYALTLEDIIPIPANGTELVIGRITDIFVDANAIQDDGYLDLEQLESVTITGLDSYHTTQRLSRLSYAKPDENLTQLGLNGTPIAQPSTKGSK